MTKRFGNPGAPVLPLRAAIVTIACATFLLSSASPALAAGDADRSRCPNEAMTGFTAALPECRAYELVTPSYTEGEPDATAGEVAVSGDQLLFGNYGSFTTFGANHDTEATGEAYIVARGEAEWNALPFGPAASMFGGAEFGSVMKQADIDAGEALFLLPSAAEPSQYLKPEAQPLWRRRADGSFAEVGPLRPPDATIDGEAGALADASSDLNVVLVEDGNRIAGEMEFPDSDLVSSFNTDQGGSGLYEYVGLGNSEPELVGVRNEGRLHGSPHLNEDAEPISQCETHAGGFDNSYNELSASGDVVFFTAHSCDPEQQAQGALGPEANEVWERVDREHSIDISEPTPAECAACDTEAASAAHELQPALFLGASEDGSKAFFTTEQELLPGHYGKNLYEYDADAPAGERIVAISGEPSAPGFAEPEFRGVVRIAESGERVYFVARNVLTTGANAEGEEPEEGAENLYFYEKPSGATEGTTTFVAALVSGGEQHEIVDQEGFCEEIEEEEAGLGEPEGEESVAYETCRASLETMRGRLKTAETLWREEDIHPAQATASGAVLAFEAVGDLTGQGATNSTQVYAYDAESGSLRRVSAAAAEGEEEYGATLPTPEYLTGHGSALPAISASGAQIVFETRDPLSSAAVAGVNNLYESSEGHTFLISDGHDPSHPNRAAASGDGRDGGSELVGIDPSGQNIFFSTVDALTSQDNDSQRKVYDARVDGGFPPTPAAPAACSGEACQSAEASRQSLAQALLANSSPLSASTAAGENVTPKTNFTTHKLGKMRAQKLKHALKLCKRDRNKRKRATCQRKARKRYAVGTTRSKRRTQHKRKSTKTSKDKPTERRTK